MKQLNGKGREVLHRAISGFVVLFTAAFLLLPSSAFANLTEFFSATGKIFVSVDGGGSNLTNGHIIEVEKPNAVATVQAAFVLAASTGFSSRVLNNGDVKINGTNVNWIAQVPSAILSSNHRADVTSIIKPIVDAAPPGRVAFTFTEVNTFGIDGEVLVVIFDDPTQTVTKTAILLFGAQNIAGDSFAITLAEPINPAASGAVLDMGLGISFGFQGTTQFSVIEVDINGVQRLSTSAGGQDDGAAANGALITVGGLDDSNANPADPFAPPTNTRTDDELYSLLPFIGATDTSIDVNTRNPSNDDNIFFAYFTLSAAAILGEGIVLSPATATNPAGTDHTVTARVVDDNGVPVQGRAVSFEVLSGPNAGNTGTDTTDANGEATFTYTGTGGAGTDVIVARFFDSQGIQQTSNPVEKIWEAVIVDTTPPSCVLTAVLPGPPTQIKVTTQDTGSGLASITPLISTNAVVTFALTPGTTDPVVVTGTKIDQSQKAQVMLEVKDVAGNTTTCDPVLTLLVRENGKPVTETLTDIPDIESQITIANGSPGIKNLLVTVNGVAFRVNGLKDFEERSFDVSSAMHEGDNNTITLTAWGKPGSQATIIISE